MSAGLLLTNARVVGPDDVLDPGWLATSAGRIEAVGEGRPEPALAADREIIDVAGASILPGFVDVHVHGAVGHEVMDAEGAGLVAMSRFFASRGVTSFLATTWTASRAATLAALSTVAGLQGAELPGAQILGVHMEGPYLSRAKCGGQDPHQVRAPDLDEARRFLDAGPVRLITMAPELARGHELVDLCLDRGVRVSVGHTEASYEQVLAAATWGVRHLTHTFNAMPPWHHRAPGPAGAALMLPALLAELIADNHHVHPALLRAFLRAKGADGVVLVTDALRPTGLEDAGEFEIGGRPAAVHGGVVQLADGSMAGSVLTMDVALRNLAAANDTTPEALWRTASRNGAIAAGVDDRKGLIAAGMDADLVVLRTGGAGADVEVELTVVAGRVVHRADAGL